MGVLTMYELNAASAHLTTETSTTLIYGSPGVHLLARSLGVSLALVSGTGNNGRVTRADIANHVQRAMQASVAAPARTLGDTSLLPNLAPMAREDFAASGPIERQPLSRIRQRSGAALHRNWVSIPHVTNHDDADITDLEAFRVRLNQLHHLEGVKFTLLALLIKACIVALKQFPEFNASLDGNGLVLKRYYHIGFAADTANGLLVPVIRNADQKGLLELATESAALAAKARDGKLVPADMRGGSFTISSLGGIGGSYFTPIIHAPQVAILGVGKAQTRVQWFDAASVPRLMLPLSLSWDHRAVDGAAAARFNASLARVLADFRMAVL